jgi:hypothetical protein
MLLRRGGPRRITDIRIQGAGRRREFLFADELLFAYWFSLQQFARSLEIRLLDVYVTRAPGAQSSGAASATALQH